MAIKPIISIYTWEYRSSALRRPVSYTHLDVYKRQIQKGEIDATDIITHRLSLEEGKHAYSIFDKREDHCIKVILKP